jgi:hypothetical protein
MNFNKEHFSSRKALFFLFAGIAFFVTGCFMRTNNSKMPASMTPAQLNDHCPQFFIDIFSDHL